MPSDYYGIYGQKCDIYIYIDSKTTMHNMYIFTPMFSIIFFVNKNACVSYDRPPHLLYFLSM